MILLRILICKNDNFSICKEDVSVVMVFSIEFQNEDFRL